MNRIFNSEFLGSELENWQVEQHVPDGYLDFAIKNETMVFYDAGNRILPNVPKLENFLVKGCFDVDWDINDKKYSLQIHFAYDEYKRQGVTLDFSCDGEKLFVSLFSPKKKLAEKELPAIDAKKIEFECKCENRILSLSLNGKEYFSHQLSKSSKGAVALSRGAFLGELRMSQFEIHSNDKFEEILVWDNLKIPFAPINGMDIPIVWTVNARTVGDDITQIDIELSGGEKTRPDVPWFPYHGHYVELLDNPYLRVESAQKVHDLTISDETFRLAIPRRHWYYTFHKEPQWPFSRRFFVRDLAADSVLFAGYKAYANCATNKHQEASVPYETAYDTKTGQIIYSGQAVAPGAVVVGLQSPADKDICNAIPQGIHDYEKALMFAKNNHYFSEDEDCRFSIELISRINRQKNVLQIDCRLENAFFEPLNDYAIIDLDPEVKAIAPGIEQLSSDAINLGKMSAGIYHLRFRLFKNNELYYENYRAFEVSSDSQSGLQASGIPTCFSMHNEVKACETDYFDPWKTDCVDVSHYIQICNTVMPHFAREKRLWELLKVYKREWFLWHAGRVLEDCDIENNKDLIKNCDYINCRVVAGTYFRPAARLYFNTHLVEILYDYAVENDFRVKEIKVCLDSEIIPDKETFNDLVENHYYQFIDFFWEKITKLSQNTKRKIAEINPAAKYSSYGPTTLYASSYKTAHAATYIGSYNFSDEMREIRDGFYIFEDYPHACRYSINRGPFLIADTKMRSPQLTIYPEMYNDNGSRVPCPDAAVARVWPSYGIGVDFVKNFGVKRVLEFVYACVWHDGENFDYWRDYGFQTRVWERERFEALLKTWGFIDKHSPRRPLKANAFICSEECCRNHKLYYDEYPGDIHEAFGDLFNTAEECVAYSYEMSRNASQNAGFVADFKSLKKLSAGEIDTLVLPPLTAVKEEDLTNIRHLHKQGVSLLAFEEIKGLEDLFGVVEGEEKTVNNITVNNTLSENPLSGLPEIAEYTEHHACKGKYKAKDAKVLLDGEIPVLFMNETKWGKTALFNIPPTAVRRQEQFNRVSMGRDSISPLINEATKCLLRYLSKPIIESDAGKIVAFEDTKGLTHIIVEEDAHPMPGKAISPLVSINMAELKVENIRCDKLFSVVSTNKETTKISLNLSPDEFAIITIG